MGNATVGKYIHVSVCVCECQERGMRFNKSVHAPAGGRQSVSLNHASSDGEGEGRGRDAM